MFGDAKSVVDRRIAGAGIQPGSFANLCRRHSGDVLHFFRRVLGLRDEIFPGLVLRRIATFERERVVGQTFGHDDVRQAIDQRNIRARFELKVIVGFDMRRRANQINRSRIGNDQLRALAQTLLHPRGKHRMTVGGIGADDHDHVGLIDGIELLRSRRCSECRLQAIARRGMADPRARIDVVVVENSAHELLHDECFFVRAAGRCDGAYGSRPYFSWMRLNSEAT